MSSPSDNASPDAFFSDQPDYNPLAHVNETLPGSVGGVVEAVKRAVVTALREGVSRTSMTIAGRRPYIDLEYPLKEVEYPGVWVRFSISRYARAGLDHEYAYQDPTTQQWTPIQVWSYNGKVTLEVVATKNKDRDQMSDALTTMLAYSRPPETWATQPNQDTRQYRDFITALNDNDYVSITPQLDVIESAGQGEDIGSPWSPTQWIYTDSYSFDVHGQTQVRFDNDGAYTLTNVQLNPTMATTVPDNEQPSPPILPPLGQGTGIGVTYRTEHGPAWNQRPSVG